MTIAELEKRMFDSLYRNREMGRTPIYGPAVGNLYRQELGKNCEEVMRVLYDSKRSRKNKQKQDSHGRWYQVNEPSLDELQKIEKLAKEN